MTPQIDSNYSVSSAKVVGNFALTGGTPFGTMPVLTFGRDAFFSFINSAQPQFLFNRAYQGLFEVDIVGTTLTSITFTGTATRTLDSTVIDAAGLNLKSSVLIQALPGQTFGVSLVAVTVTSSILRVGDYSYALL
jgi:hypothetical protein